MKNLTTINFEAVEEMMTSWGHVSCFEIKTGGDNEQPEWGCILNNGMTYYPYKNTQTGMFPKNEQNTKKAMEFISRGTILKVSGAINSIRGIYEIVY